MSTTLRHVLTIAVIGIGGLAPLAAQSPVRSWSRPADLAEWKLAGRARGTTPRDAGGLAITIDPQDAPNTLKSPRLDLRASEIGTLRIDYEVDFGDLRTPVFVVGWIDNARDAEEIEDCALVVPLTPKTSTTAVVDLRASKCWRADAVVQEIAINVDGLVTSAARGRVWITGIALTRRDR